MLKKRFVNLACGSSYVRDTEWTNLDYVPSDQSVRQADLLGKLPFDNETVDVIYCSHFLEHIPRQQVHHFLGECLRVLKPSGIARFVLPDFEEMCNEYLHQLSQNDYAKASFLMLSMLDQLVRLRPGGQLGEFYRHLQADSENEEMTSYVLERTGETIEVGRSASLPGGSVWVRLLRNPRKLWARIERRYCRMLSLLFPAAFRQQNISFAGTGERHQWVYDYYSFDRLLRHNGFASVERMSSSTSSIAGFPFYPLDLTVDRRPRKGSESMYVEATKS